MSATIELPPLVTTLGSLAADINAEQAAIEANDADSLQRAIKAGEYLNRAKTMVEPGTWTTWLAENVAVSRDSVSRYRRYARYQHEIRHCRSLNEALAWLRERGLDHRDENNGAYMRTDVVVARQNKARELRASGLTWAKVGEALGVSVGHAHHLANPERARASMRAYRKRQRAEAKRNAEIVAQQKFERQFMQEKGPRRDLLSNLIRASKATDELRSWDEVDNPEAKALLEKLYVQLMEAEETVKKYALVSSL